MRGRFEHRCGGGRPGFTLIELLVVVVIIGILASVAMAKYRSVRETAFLTVLKSDVEILAKHQEIYHLKHMTYGSLADLTDFRKSQGVEITFGYVDADGWGAEATHSNLATISCGMIVGAAPVGSGGPATNEDMLTCG